MVLQFFNGNLKGCRKKSLDIFMDTVIMELDLTLVNFFQFQVLIGIKFLME